MECVITFEVVMERLRKALKLDNDKALAENLGLKSSAYYNRKSRESIPWDEVLAVALKHDIRADWLCFGVGDTFYGQSFTLPPPVAIDPQFLGEILGEIAVASLKVKELADEEKREYVIEMAAIGGYAAMICNKVGFIAEQRERTTKIRALANDYVNARMIFRSAESFSTRQRPT